MKKLNKFLLIGGLVLGFALLAVGSLMNMAKAPVQVKADSTNYIDFAIKEKSGVTFIGGNGGFQRVNLSAGKPTMLPDLIRDDSLDYQFDGWYDGDTKVTESTVFSEYTVVYDRWTSIAYDANKIISSVNLSPAVPVAGMTQSTYQAACGEITQSGLWTVENYKLYEGINAKSGNELTGSVEANKNYSAKIVLGVDYSSGYRIGRDFMSNVTTSSGLVSGVSYIGSNGSYSDVWDADIRRVSVTINFTYNDFVSYPKSQYASNGQSLTIKFETTTTFVKAALLQKTGFSTWNDLYIIKDSSTNGSFMLPALYNTTAEFEIYVEFPDNTSLTGDPFTIVYGSGSTDEDGRFLIQPPEQVNVGLNESYVVQYMFNRGFDNMWLDIWKDGYWGERAIFHNNGVIRTYDFDYATSRSYRIGVAYTYKNDSKTVYSNMFTVNTVDNATSWTVTLVGNNGFDEVLEIENVSGDYVIPECNFTAPAGKEFEQWVCDGVRFNPGDHLDITRARTIVALWKPTIKDSYSITFASNGGSGTMNEVLATYNEEYIIPSCNFTAPAGKKFSSWWANGNTYNPGDTLVIKKDTQFVVNWEDDTFEVTFNANGGDGVMSAISDAPNNYTLPTCEFTAPAGKQFIGWALNDIDATPIGEGKEIKLTSDSTLYAIWDDNDPYVITYDDGKGNQVSFTLPEGSNYTVATFAELGFNAPVGKAFDHWEDYFNDGNYAPGTSRVVPNEDTYYMARFNSTGENVYTISFDASGQSGDMNSVEVVGGTEFTIPKPEYTASSGTEFAGWALNGDITKVYKPFDKIVINESITLHAVWRAPREIEAEYDGKVILGGKLSAKNIVISLVYDDEYKEPVLANSVQYSINGTPIADIENYVFNEIGIAAITVTYDGYEATMGIRVVNEFHVSFDANGGKGTMEEEIINSSSYTLPNNKFASVGNTEFRGWLVNGNEYNPGDVITLTGDTVIKAVWDSIYEISFNSNGGIGNMVSASIKAGEFTLPECGYTAPEGYEFAGWKVNNAGEILEAGTKINVAANVVLHAQWKGSQVEPEKTLVSITLSGNQKTEFTVGDTFSAEGLVVTAHYSDDSGEAIDLNNVEIAGYNMNQEGKQTVTVSYQGKTATYEMTVKAKDTPVTPKTLTGIEVTGTYKTEYAVGETFSTEGIVVKAVYSNGDKEDVALNEVTFSGYNMNQAGNQTVTATWNELSTTFQILVKQAPVDPEKTLVSISLSGNQKTEFTVGDAFSAEGLVVTAHYSDDSGEAIALNNVGISGYNMNQEGKQTVTVSYQGKTATYEITVKAKDTPVTPDDPVTPDEPSKSSGLPAGAVVGIVIGSALVIGVGGFALVWFVIKKKTWADFVALFKKK